jgi:hypothetical protein
VTTIGQYGGVLRPAVEKFSASLGVDLAMESQSIRVAVVSVLFIVSILIKLLVDSGVITDSELLAELDTALAGRYPPEPVVAPQPVPVVVATAGLAAGHATANPAV